MGRDNRLMLFTERTTGFCETRKKHKTTLRRQNAERDVNFIKIQTMNERKV
jgi:hypothetical protein